MDRRYALVDRNWLFTGQTIIVDDTNPPAGPNDVANTDPYWVPFNKTTVDTTTNGGRNGFTKEMSIIINDDGNNVIEVVQERTLRDLTPQELIDKDERKFNRSFNKNGDIIRALLRLSYNQENRIRTLEGANTVTVEEFKTYIKNNMR